MNAIVRNAPDATNDSASSPPGFATRVDVKKTAAATGTRMMRIVRNWRRRYAIAPSWIAFAISRIVGVPSSAARTPRMRNRPTRIASSAVAIENTSQNHSAPVSLNSW